MDNPTLQEYPQGTNLEATGLTKLCMGFTCLVSFITLILFVIVGLILKPIDLQIDFSSFMEADVPAFIIRSGFLGARKARVSTSEGRRLEENSLMLYRPYDFEVSYAAKGDVANLMSIRGLTLIKEFERKLRNLPLWYELCKKHTQASDRSLCNPGISLANYISPQPVFDANGSDIVPISLRFDGSVPDALPLAAATYLVPTEIHKHLFRKDAADATGLSGTLTEVRTVYRFNFVCCPYGTPPAKQKVWGQGIKKQWKTMLETQVLPYLQDQSESFALEIAYGGSEVYDIEISQVIDGDLNLAYISMAVVFIYIAFHTRSLFLSVVALTTIVLTVPLSYVFFAFIADTTEMNIASLLSLFLVVGLGSDVIFVYMDFWRESKKIGSSASARLFFTLWNAGKGTLATSIATSLSFFANLASVLRSLREFGFFMGLCVMFVWSVVPLIFLPSCMFDELWFSCYRLECQRRRREVNAGGPYQSCRDRSLRRFIQHLHKHRWLYLLAPAITLIIMLILAISEAETSSKTPELLPEDHAMNQKSNVLKAFNGVESTGVIPIRSEIQICDPTNFETDCVGSSIAWCMASEIPRDNPGECQCYERSRGSGCPGQLAMPITHRIIGTDSLSETELWTLGETLPSYASFPTSSRLDHMAQSKFPSVILHNWLDGRFEFRPATQVVTMMTNYANLTTCGLDYLCSCDDIVCDPGDSWIASGSFFLGQRRLRPSTRNNTRQEASAPVDSMLEATRSSSRRLSERHQLETDSLEHALDRRLQPYLLLTTDTTNMVRVQVVHGLILHEGTPLLGKRDSSAAWLFNKHFDFSNPWAQRSMLNFCTGQQMRAWGLHVRETQCWIVNFKQWIQKYIPGDTEPRLPDKAVLRFPLSSTNFDHYLSIFSKDHNINVLGQTGLQSKVSEFMWLRGGKLKAAYMSFLTDVDRSTSGASASDFKEKWDVYLSKFAPRALDGMPTAYHTSSLWVRAEVQGELIRSVLVTIAIVVVLAFLTVFVATESVLLSCTVVIATVGVLSGLLFFIVYIMNDNIGPIEVIALIVFIGYSVTYSLHIAHHYSDPAAMVPSGSNVERSFVRLTRVTYAINSISGGICGSAITTIGCSAFLLGCTLNIFQKLGGVAIAVTVMSIILSLFSLPAFLLIAGPRGAGFLGIFKKLMPRISLCFRSAASAGSASDDLPPPPVDGKDCALPVGPPAARDLQLGKGDTLEDIVQEIPQLFVLPTSGPINDFRFTV